MASLIDYRLCLERDQTINEQEFRLRVTKPWNLPRADVMSVGFCYRSGFCAVTKRLVLVTKNTRLGLGPAESSPGSRHVRRPCDTRRSFVQRSDGRLVPGADIRSLPIMPRRRGWGSRAYPAGANLVARGAQLCARTTSTGHGAFRMTPSATLPSSARRMPPRP